MTEPRKRISKRGLKVWRITGLIYSVLLLLISGASITLNMIFDWSTWLIAVSVSLLIMQIILFVILFPSIRWKHWRYEVREEEIELQHGIFVVKKTLVPMVRVQHVDTQQGPLLRKYRLATVSISTAATIHEIPALDIEEAEELRHSISKLARMADEDV